MDQNAPEIGDCFWALVHNTFLAMGKNSADVRKITMINCGFDGRFTLNHWAVMVDIFSEYWGRNSSFFMLATRGSSLDKLPADQVVQTKNRTGSLKK